MTGDPLQGRRSCLFHSYFVNHSSFRLCPNSKVVEQKIALISISRKEFSLLSVIPHGVIRPDWISLSVSMRPSLRVHFYELHE